MQLNPALKKIIMNPLSNLTTDKAIIEAADSVGTSYAALDSAVYPMTVAMAYLQKATSGAVALALTLKGGDREVRQTLWMTSGTAKGAKNYYEKDGERFYLPGFTHANNLCLLTVGKEISEMETEVKVLSVYSKEAKAEVPTKMDVFMDLLGKEVLVGLIKQTVDKNKKNEATGAYEATGETREENEVDKFFRARDRLTTAEIRAQVTKPGFINVWEAKFNGLVRNKTAAGSKKPALGGTPGGASGSAPGSAFGAASNMAKKPSSSLFASA